MDKMRFQRVDPCKGCNRCADHQRCAEVRKPLKNYGGIRFTSDGFDCALPVSIDSHSICSYACLYCFSDNLIQHRENRAKGIGQTPLSFVESIFKGSESKEVAMIRQVLKYDHLKNGYPTPVQLGAICDPCDNIERQQGWLLEFIKLAVKYNQPVRMSTKGNILLLPEYQAELKKAPHLFWVAFSIITPDDRVIELIDQEAPNATMRLRTMKALSKIGVKTSLRFRPMMPSVSDSTPKHPKAYKELVEKAADAGACAVSYDVMFVPGGMTVDTKRRWEKLSEITGINYRDLYHTFGPTMACMRPPYTWTENIMHAVRDVAHANGLVVGISDPVWKQLTDTGCCCGIMPDDPVFGNWQEESATNQLLLARDTGKLIGPDDICPSWADVVKEVDLCNAGVGPLINYKRRHNTWKDKLKRDWNNLSSQRGPLNYFQGALLPARRDAEGNIYYRYEGLKRQHQPDYIWQVEEAVNETLL